MVVAFNDFFYVLKHRTPQNPFPLSRQYPSGHTCTAFLYPRSPNTPRMPFPLLYLSLLSAVAARL